MNVATKIGVISVFLVSTILISSCIYDDENKSKESHHSNEKAINLINTRISSFYNTEQRGDTIYFQDINSNGTNPNAALIIDSIVEYGSSGKRLVVMRVFKVSNNQHRLHSDTTKWLAITEMGSGRGYTVTLALASV